MGVFPAGVNAGSSLKLESPSLTYRENDGSGTVRAVRYTILASFFRNLPCPSLPKRGWNAADMNSPLIKGGQGGFELASVIAIAGTS